MTDTPRDYPYLPIPFTQVKITDQFWADRLETNQRVTVPYDLRKCEETGRIDNFAKAGGLMDGPHEGIHFNDSDLFKVLEGAAYTLKVQADPQLEALVDSIIEKIAAAQESDGYLYTARTIDPQNVSESVGPERWSNLPVSHELYNVGHMYEAAVAYYDATGKRAFLDVALRNAELIMQVFNEDGLRNVPGHQEIEIGLVRLYRLTGDERYLKQARFFLDERGHANGRELQQIFDDPGYMQDHLPVVDQTEAVGHSVRAVYMYTAMADVAALTGDAAYIQAIQRIWENVVYKKMALTGGIGARHRTEAFGDDYELPNLTAYNETCAAIAAIFWNQRLFLLSGEGKYIDVLERTLYNGFLAGVSLEGDAFFYVNPLESDGQYGFNNEGSLVRQPWFNCSCCPTNVVRLLPGLSGYIYAVRDNAVYVNLYIGSEGSVQVSGRTVELVQQTDYPWSGNIRITLQPEVESIFDLRLRIPGWAVGQPVPGDLYRYADASSEPVSLRVNGEAYQVAVENGYCSIMRAWQAGDVVELTLPMPVRRVMAHAAVDECAGKVALERGPVVYAAEWADNGGQVLNLSLSAHTQFVPEYVPDLLGGVVVLRGEAINNSGQKQDFTAIPYYAWAHRGPGEMAVWLSRAD